MKETDLAKPIIDYLESRNWDVYQEVPCGSGVADIVAVLDQKVWVIELKKTLSIQLLDQAILRHYKVNYVSIGVPLTKTHSSMSSPAVTMILNTYGIGVFTVGKKDKVVEERIPKLSEHASDRLIKEVLKSLHPKMKQNKAGSLPGNNWTPWKEWKKNVEKTVFENPGITPKEMVEKLKTLAPYTKPKNAEQAAVYYARNGLIERVRVAKENNRLRLYPRKAIETRSKGMWG